jgi:hypothetical protein
MVVQPTAWILQLCQSKWETQQIVVFFLFYSFLILEFLFKCFQTRLHFVDNSGIFGIIIFGMKAHRTRNSGLKFIGIFILHLNQQFALGANLLELI